MPVTVITKPFTRPTVGHIMMRFESVDAATSVSLRSILILLSHLGLGRVVVVSL
jgi:hypothetical protein